MRGVRCLGVAAMLVAFGAPFTAQTPSQPAPTPTQAPAPAAPPATQTPPELVRLVDLPRADDLATRELVESVVARFEVLNGYRAASEDQALPLPITTAVCAVCVLPATPETADKTLLLRFGF